MIEDLPVLTPDVLIIGGGPAGLTAAASLAPRVTGEVLVVEREQQAGGIPRHSDHLGYGIRDRHRFQSGPTYARDLVAAATASGAAVRTGAMVTGWTREGAADVTSPAGRFLVRPRTTVLATGARERPRTARWIPGDRPAGVYTTGQLQNLVYLHHRRPGRAAVVVGGELVSWSAVMTLREARTRVALLTTQHASVESYAVFNLIGRSAFRTPVATRSRVVRVIGKGRVEAVEVANLDTGVRTLIECDTVVFTGDWIPDHELARAAGLDIDAGTRGPLVDTALRTSTAGMFAIGNLIHPVDTADVAALDGAHVADQIVAWLEGPPHVAKGVRLAAEAPLQWIAPGVIRPGDPAPPRARLLLWTTEPRRLPRVSALQDGHVITTRTVPWPASPGRVFRLPWSLLGDVDPNGDDVTIRFAN
jgi:thioredoxin reductase